MSQFSYSEKPEKSEKIFDFMAFAKLVCNPKALVTENKLLDKNNQILARLRETKKVVEFRDSSKKLRNSYLQFV
jgi:hypothetical protein